MIIDETQLKDLLFEAWIDGRNAGNLESEHKIWDSNRSSMCVNLLLNKASATKYLTINETAALYGQEVKYEYQDCIDEHEWHPFCAIVDYELLESIAKGSIRHVSKLT